MPKSMKLAVLLAKVQVAVGTESVPTPAANAMLVRMSKPSIITAEYVQRNLLRGFKGNFGSLAVGVHREIEIELELAGPGTAGLAPKWAPLLLACGTNETLLALTSATYALVGSGEPVLTIVSHIDGVDFKMTDCKGSVSGEVNSKNIPVLKFKFMGKYSTMADATFPTGMVYSDFQMPKTVGHVNTPTLTFFGFAGVVQSLTFDIANILNWKDRVNGSGAESPDRKPVGTITMEMPTVAALNFGELARLGTEGALQLVHGVTAGNIIQLSMPKVQLTSDPTINDDNDTAMVSAQFSILPNTGNDEFSLVAR